MERHRKARRAFALFGHAVLVLSLALLAILAVGPRTGRYQTMTVLTASMSPVIPAGSVVVVRPVDPSAIEVGDVITYRIPVQDRRIVTHRVVEVTGDRGSPTIRTKGDALEESDAWTTRFQDAPVWRVDADVPYAGYALRALREPVLRRGTVLVAPAVLALLLLLQIWQPRRAAGADQLDGVPYDGPLVVAPGDIRLPSRLLASKPAGRHA